MCESMSRCRSEFGASGEAGCVSPGCHADATCRDGECRCNDGFVGDGVRSCREACICRLRGDPVVETCDGQWMLLIGTNKYTLTKHLDPSDDCSFNVEVKAGSAPGQIGQTYPRYMDVMVFGLNIRLDQYGRVYVGHKEVSLPANDLHADLRVERIDSFVVVNTTRCGFAVGFDGNAAQSVSSVLIPARYSKQVQGLCGDFDGEMDDLKTRDNVDVEYKPERYKLISDSYVVHEQTEGFDKK